MNRRDLLRGLLALPLAPLVAKFLPSTYLQWKSKVRREPSLLDLTKSLKGDQLLPVVEALSRQNPLLQDMVWREKDCRIGNRITYE